MIVLPLSEYVPFEQDKIKRYVTSDGEIIFAKSIEDAENYINDQQLNSEIHYQLGIFDFNCDLPF